MSEIQKCGVEDVYWGEFSQSNQQELNRIFREDGYEAGRAFVREKLDRDTFIFGRGRTDFLYYLDLDKNSVCLDCGAGTGIHAFNLAREANEVHAFDLSLDRLELMQLRAAAEGVTNIKLYHSDFKTLPFKDGMFDAIAMNGVVEWLGVINDHDNPRDDQVTVLRQMYKFMKTSGKLYIGIENRFAASYRNGRDHSGLRFTSYMPRFLANVVTKRKKGHSYRTYTYGANGYRKLLEESGFARDKITMYITHPGYNYPQYIIAHDDLAALRFFYTSFARSQGMRGRIVAVLARSNIFLRLLRTVTWSYGIVAEK